MSALVSKRVGENLQDHVLVSGVVFKYKGKMPDRPVDSNAVEAALGPLNDVTERSPH